MIILDAANQISLIMVQHNKSFSNCYFETVQVSQIWQNKQTKKTP